MTVRNAVADAGHTDSSGLWCLAGLKPVTKVGEHLVMILEPRAETEAVVTCRIDIHGTFIACIAHG